MNKEHWLSFLQSKVSSQAFLESSQKVQTWALALLVLFSFGAGMQGLGTIQDKTFLYPTQLLFLALGHIFFAGFFYLPGLLEKGRKNLARMLLIRDLTSLVFVSIALLFWAVILAAVSFHAALPAGVTASNFSAFVSWTNFAASAFYLAGFAFYFLSLTFFPSALLKMIVKGAKGAYAGFGFHAGFAILTALAYFSVTKAGSPEFFEQLRLAGLFWVAIGGSLFLMGRVLSDSQVPALSSLEYEFVTGKLERPELVPHRFKEALVSSRFLAWIKTISKDVAEKGSRINKLSMEAGLFVSADKPSETDLRQVEDRYRHAEALYRELEKTHERFMITAAFYFLSEAEQEKAAELRDQFSRELRNAKLELATIRKSIDERLVSLKNTRELPKEVPTLEELTLGER